MTKRPLARERGWAGYTIGLEEAATGWRYRLRRDLRPGDPYRALGRLHTGGPFGSEEAALEAAKLRVIELERRRPGDGEREAFL